MWIKKEQDNPRNVALDHMTLEMLVFDFAEYPFVIARKTLFYGKNAVTEGCVRGQASIRPRLTDVLVMHMVSEGEVPEFIITGGTKRWIILSESRQ